MSDSKQPVEPRFVPTWNQLLDLWVSHNPINGGNHANAPEKIEYELGFLQFYDQQATNGASGLTPRGPDTSPSTLATPEGNRP